MWRGKPPSAPRWLEQVSWESLAVHLPRFKAKVEREQEKKIPHRERKGKAETLGWQLRISSHLFSCALQWKSWTLLRIIPWHSVKALSCLFYSPPGTDTWSVCRAEQQSFLPCGKYLLFQTGPLEREKPRGAWRGPRGTALLNQLQFGDAQEFKP